MIEAAFAPAKAAVEQGLIPGATLGIVTADGRRWVEVAGQAAIVPVPEPLTRAHWFDLASLTKPIATATMILRLAEEGRLDLDRPLTDAIPDLRQYDRAAPERRLTFRDCLSHRTYLPAVEPIYTYGDDPARLRAFVLQREWRSGPRVYSDINYILLGIAVERITGAPLAEAFIHWGHIPSVRAELVEASSFRSPQDGPSTSSGRTGGGVRTPPTATARDGLNYGPPPGPAVATEACTWRGRVLKGEVHDENAYALGGAAGHAGLFGTVDGVLDYALGLLDGTGATPAMLTAMRNVVHDTRTCGWDSYAPGWPGGDACSPGTIGHTGFTGTGLWVDVERGLAWTLLTNRVHPTRHGADAIFALRPAVSEAAIAAFDAEAAR